MSAGEDKESVGMATNGEHFDERNKEGKSTTDDSSVQQQGDFFVPEVADGMVEKVAEEMYGLKVVQCTELKGYADRNYHIRVSTSESSNPHLTSVSSDGYVMRIYNSLDTGRPEFFYAQIEMIRHLGRHGITAQDAVQTLTGELIAFYHFPSPDGQGDGRTHAVLLRTFIVGKMVIDVTVTPDLCYKLGKYVGSMTKALETFHHPFYDTFDNLWSLSHVPKLTEYAHVITDVDRRQLVDEVISEFSCHVLPRLKEIRAAVIHGDGNDRNILVRRKSTSSPDSTSASASENPDEYVIAGILDFQDAAYTHPLYDLAILIAYTSRLVDTFDLREAGGHILAGYTSVVELPELEASLLRLCVAARMVQSMVLGAYNHSLNPTNKYLLTTSKRGWHMLRVMWDTPADELNQMWVDIQQSYKEEKRE